MLDKFVPKMSVNTVYDIDLQHLQELGIKGIITDLDNTLVGPNEVLAVPELIAWFERVDALGFKAVIVSNNQRTRVATFAEPLSIPYIYRAKKPGNKAFKKALSLMNLSAHEAAMVGDQLLTDVFGGNRMGLFTILVQPIAIQDEEFFTRINRRIEKKLVNRLKRRNRYPWEDQE